MNNRKLRWLWPRSLRWRLQLWLGFLLICILAAFAVAVFQLRRVNRLAQIDAELQSRVTVLSRIVREVYRDSPGPVPGENAGRPDEHRPPPQQPPDLRNKPGPERPPHSEYLSLPPETAMIFGADDSYYFTIWYRDGTVIEQSENAPESPVPQRGERDTLLHFRTRGKFREAVHCSGFGECSMAGTSLETQLSLLREFRLELIGVAGSVLIAGLAVGWWITIRSTRPMEQISAAAVRLSAGNLAERVSITDPDSEVGRLGVVLNSAFARLEAAFDRQQQFTADAAHELRTPLAVLITETQTSLSRGRGASEYRETVEGCLETAQQMRRITETLLQLARIDGCESPVSRQIVDMAEVCRSCVPRLESLAQMRGITILTELRPALTMSEPERLEQVVTNLVENAIYYNRPAGQIRIVTSSGNGIVALKVSDTGFGIPAADLPHVFDRFYRSDKSRSRTEGHAGLGLTICKSLVEMDHGIIRVESMPGEGTTFTIRMPRAGSTHIAFT